MRPISPTIYHRSLLEMMGLADLIPVAARMVLRGLQRRPISAALSSIGIAFSVAVLVLSGFFTDAIDYLIEFQFSTAQRHDVQVAFIEPTSPSVRHDLRHLPGVQLVEPFRAVPVNLRNGHLEYRTSILGLDGQRDLFRLLNTSAKPIRLPPSGLVLGDKLADILKVTPGDSLTVEVLEGEEPVRTVTITGLASEYSGTNAYMDRQQLNHLMRETDAISGAFLAGGLGASAGTVCGAETNASSRFGVDQIGDGSAVS